jgi:hypothetical protein
MTNVPGARGREPGELKGEAADADVFFPSEGTFSAVVPLSQVRGGRVSLRDSAASAVAHEEPEETTLVPSRVSPSERARRAPETRRGGQHWLAMTAAVALSVFAGLAVGAYMVWTRQAQPPVTTAVDAGAQTQAATEAPQPEPSPTVATPAAEVVAATSTPEVATADNAVVKVEKAETSESARKAEPTAPPAVTRASAAEPVARRSVETERRASARERAKADEESPAPKPALREAAPRRQAAPARTRPPATAANGRALPVSSPPPSAKSRTVIQWP